MTEWTRASYECSEVLDSLRYLLRPTPIMLFLGLMSGGAGHGDYFLAKILFPYTLLSTAAFDRIESPFVVLTFIQYPAYGVVIGLANVQRKLLISCGALALIHAVAVSAAFLFASPVFFWTVSLMGRNITTRWTGAAGAGIRVSCDE